MSTRLYYSDPMKGEFDATVIAVRDVTRAQGSTGRARDAATALVLDRTAFYPEGGGQPADRGTLNSAAVVDVQKDNDGTVLHFVNDWDGAKNVHGAVDWTRRWDYMQQHTGQHIISGALYKAAGINTVSVHQGEDYTTIEVDVDDVDQETVVRVEDAVNAVIAQNVEVHDQWVGEDEVGLFPLRRPPKVSGSIRVVTVGDFDCVACGGVHTLRTSDVRLVKHIGTERIRGRTRLYWKIGDRAIADYRLKDHVVARLVDYYSAKPHEIVERAERYGRRLGAAEAEVEQLVKRLGREIAVGLVPHSDNAPDDEGIGKGATPRTGSTKTGAGVVFAGGAIAYQMVNEDKRLFRAVLEALEKIAGPPASLTNEVDGRVQWGAYVPESRTEGFSKNRNTVLAPIEGKGGGKPPLYQGVGDRVKGVADFHQAFLRAMG